jgi:recombination protein RecT
MSNENQPTAIAKQADKEIKEYLSAAVASLRSVANKYMDAERLVKIALVARAKTPLLMKCSRESILTSLMQAAEMGLEPNTPLQHAALVPRKNKRTGQYECNFMPMYRGLIELGRRSGVLQTARAVPIYECDEYAIEEGLVHTIIHKPNFRHADFGDPNKVIMVYAVAQLTGGGTEWTYMTGNQITRIQHRSPAGSDGPWVTDWEEMAKKTVIRRLFKLLPLTTNVAEAVAADGGDEDVDFGVLAAATAAQADAEEAGKVIDIATATDGGAQLAQELTEKKKAPRTQKPPKEDKPAAEPAPAPPKGEGPAQGTLV